MRWYSRRFPGLFDRASGPFIWNSTGKRYLDFFTGAGTLSYGHNHPVMKRALVEYIERDGIAHSLDFRTEAREEFTRAFDEAILQPRGLNYRMLFPGPAGTNAVEAALKLARRKTGRSIVAAFTNAFHGMSLGALAASSGAAKRRAGGVALGEVVRLPFDNYFGARIDTIEIIEQIISDPGSGIEPPAAFLVETVQGEGGLQYASMEWLQRLGALARRNDSLLIIDDIQAGCGRTGDFFSFELAGIEPDIVCLSKALSGYGLPLALVLLKEDVDVLAAGEHSGTFRGNNHAFVTGAVAARFWSDPHFIANIANNVAIVDEWLLRFCNRYKAEGLSQMGRGLIRGVAFPVPGQASAVCARAFEEGLLVETSGASEVVVKMLPPLNIEPSVHREGLAILEAAADEILAL